MPVAGCYVSSPAEHANHEEGHSIGQVSGLPVDEVDVLFQGFFGVSAMIWFSGCNDVGLRNLRVHTVDEAMLLPSFESHGYVRLLGSSLAAVFSTLKRDCVDTAAVLVKVDGGE